MKQQKTRSNVPGQYDTVSKTLIHEHPEDWATFTLGTSDVEVLRILETEQPTIQTHRADSFILVNVGGEEAIVHIEIQTRDSRDPRMPSRMMGYIGRAVEAFELPIYSHVIYLAPNAGRSDPGEYVQNVSGYPIHVGYKVIRLSELEGERFLEGSLKGLLPFTPLMRPPEGTEGEPWLRRCVEVVDSATRDRANRAELIVGLAVSSGLVFTDEVISRVFNQIIKEPDMEESWVIQHFVQQVKEKSVQQLRESLIESILENLEFRFETRNLPSVAARLASIYDIEQLKQLRRATLETPSIADFQQTLASANGTGGS